MAQPRTYLQHWPAPANPLPIVIIGAGSIVNDAHLPAYRKAGFAVAGIFDIDGQRAADTAKRWGIDEVFGSIEEATADGTRAVYDLATPPSAIAGILRSLPEGAAVLIQKPMGENLEQALEIHGICRDKRFDAAVNFQLRFSPMMLAVRDAIASGELGEILDLEVHVNIRTPWETFPFLKPMERVEIAVHSIHYLDLIRSFAGEPEGAFVRSLKDPRVPDFAQTRTSIILDYGEHLRCLLSINHNHDFGPDFQAATIRVEGSKGCALAKLGLLLDYPRGKPDELWICEAGKEWRQVELSGRWFPDAFAGVMSNLQRFHAGEDAELFTRVDDALRTMELVESCFVANRSPSVRLERDGRDA
jgi:predicted dehydrogenase